MESILKNKMSVLVGISGLALLGFYVLYFRKEYFDGKNSEKGKNKLNLTLRQLIDDCKNENVTKIVITESRFNGSREFRSKLITRLHNFLKEQHLNVLVNCSPIKLFNASAEVLFQKLTYIDPDKEEQWMSYLANALKCQLILQKTILDIYKIKRSQQKVIMLCDSNSLDLETVCMQDIWKKFQQKYQIQSKELRQNYNIVFHIKSNVGVPGFHTTEETVDEYEENNRIQQVWKMSTKYFPIFYQSNCILQQNIEIVLEYIINKLKPYLPENVTYKRKQVFAKEF